LLFNSFEFIFLFLPICFLGYFLLVHRQAHRKAKLWLALASLFYYSWWKVSYLPLILGSMVFNYYIGNRLTKVENHNLKTKLVLWFAVLSNLALLGYFKYSDFLIENINQAFSSSIDLLHLALPLAISFFTFQQIAYIVDSYQGETKEYDFLNYMVFVSFFPQLIAGPIVHHKEMMPQFEDSGNQRLKLQNVCLGLFIFSIGLFKKVVIADTFAKWATIGYDHSVSLTLVEAWVTSLSYSLQLYFDFCGYTDMAMGAAFLFNIELPPNFNSPYKATSIQDFWRRWHMTLSRFLRDYIYIPLGGNRKAEFRTLNNLMTTFLLGGLWHGAGWTFIFWGFLHGAGLIVHRVWNGFGYRLPKWIAWFVTFQFVNIAWVFFRATSWSDAIKVLKGMAGMNGVILPEKLAGPLQFLGQWNIQFSAGNYPELMSKTTLLLIFVFLVVVGWFKNSLELKDEFQINFKTVLFSAFFFVVAVLSMNRLSAFLYFNF